MAPVQMEYNYSLNNVILHETLLSMASIYCGDTADDVPLFCVDVERVSPQPLQGTFFLYGSQ